MFIYGLSTRNISTEGLYRSSNRVNNGLYSPHKSKVPGKRFHDGPKSNHFEFGCDMRSSRPSYLFDPSRQGIVKELHAWVHIQLCWSQA